VRVLKKTGVGFELHAYDFGGPKGGIDHRANPVRALSRLHAVHRALPQGRPARQARQPSFWNPVSGAAFTAQDQP
jgi:hypothetical protein